MPGADYGQVHGRQPEKTTAWGTVEGTGAPSWTASLAASAQSHCLLPHQGQNLGLPDLNTAPDVPNPTIKSNPFRQHGYFRLILSPRPWLLPNQYNKARVIPAKDQAEDIVQVCVWASQLIESVISVWVIIIDARRDYSF